VIAVIDIGKTNVKLQIADSNNQLVASFVRKNAVINGKLFPHADITGIWSWLLDALKNYEQVGDITAIMTITHGATAALVNPGLSGDGLVLPVLDYEYVGISSCNDFYAGLRPDFNETFSPDLPAGLNLGRQLYWLQQNFPRDFAKARYILMYAQYWGWLFTRHAAGEVTSLGCHTDLWAPETKRYSSLIARCEWHNLMPPIKSAWESLGDITAEMASTTGLPKSCKVYVGVHDSNASYARYLLALGQPTSSFTVVSTGTWCVLMQNHGDLAALTNSRDTLANCDIFGEPVNCARFMGGREYELICQRLGGSVGDRIDRESIETVLKNSWMVTPDFSGGNGPFGGLSPVINCPQSTSVAASVATLYYALMIDQRLSDLYSSGSIFIEGAILGNPTLCQLVAQLRPDQPVYLSTDKTGTVQGGIMLTNIGEASTLTPAAELCQSGGFEGLNGYKMRWEALISAQVQASL
jgi:sugar (pentulose or hexulose) kinase